MSKFIIVALMWLIGSNSFAITTPFKTKKLKVICATKGKKKKYYKIGEGVAIWVKQKDSVVKIKGFINNTYGDSVEIGSFKKRKQTFISIHINQIEKIEKIDIEVKRLFYVGAGVLSLISIPLLILIGKSTASPMAYIAIIPAAAAAFIIVYGLLTIWANQKIFSKSKKKGWSFTTGEKESDPSLREMIWKRRNG